MEGGEKKKGGKNGGGGKGAPVGGVFGGKKGKK